MNWLITFQVFTAIAAFVGWIVVSLRLFDFVERRWPFGGEFGPWFFVVVGIGLPLALLAGWLVGTMP